MDKIIFHFDRVNSAQGEISDFLAVEIYDLLDQYEQKQRWYSVKRIFKGVIGLALAFGVWMFLKQRKRVE